MVKVIATAKGEIKSVLIDDSLIIKEEKEMTGRFNCCCNQ